MPNIGDTIALSNQLFDSDTTKFVRASLRDDAGAPLGASPVSLTHDANGNYTNATVIFPAGTDFVSVTYEVFNDAGFTTPSPDHSSSIDTFDLAIPAAAILDCLTVIKDAIAALQILVGAIGTVSDIKAIVTDDAVIAKIEDLDVGTVISEKDPQQSVVATDEAIALNLDDDTIVSEVECD